MPLKMKMVRDYSGGNITDRIAKAETEEELEGIRQAVIQLVREKMLSARALRRINVAGKTRARELETRIILPAPRSLILPPQGLTVPKKLILP